MIKIRNLEVKIWDGLQASREGFGANWKSLRYVDSHTRYRSHFLSWARTHNLWDTASFVLGSNRRTVGIIVAPSLDNHLFVLP